MACVEELLNVQSIKHAVILQQGSPQLEIYLPATLDKQDTDLLHENETDTVCLDNTASKDEPFLRLKLHGYAVEKAAYKKASRKYVLRLTENFNSPRCPDDDGMSEASMKTARGVTEPGVALEDVIPTDSVSEKDHTEETYHDAQPAWDQLPSISSTIPDVVGSEAEPGKEELQASMLVAENDDVSTSKASKKKKKKNKQQGSEEKHENGTAAEGQSVSDATGIKDQDAQAEQGSTENGENSTTTAFLSKSQKKNARKRLKKKAGTGAGGDEAGGSSGDEHTEAQKDQDQPASTPAAQPSSANKPVKTAEKQQQQQTAAAPVTREPEASTSSQMADPFAKPAAESMLVEQGSGKLSRQSTGFPLSAAASGLLLTPRSGMSRRLQVSLDLDFEDEPVAVYELAPNKEKPLIEPNPLQGPYVRTGFGKIDKPKGEDKWLEAPGNLWDIPSLNTNPVGVSAWGVFDGHGGKQAATYASKNLLPTVMNWLNRTKGDIAVPSPVPGASTEEMAAWVLQDCLIDRLPKALYAGFTEVDAECQRRFKTSGTTATLAVLVGWELIVANVGDSCAYLDTGSEIIQISGNHRVTDNPEEQERVKAAGGIIAQSDVNGVIAGPLRVWPGGLAMTRSIGDYEAGKLVTGEPEIRQITIPHAGARLIIASDGLWDAVQPKSIIHKVRKQVAGAAANQAVHGALDKKGLSDDITVIVVDFCAGLSDKMPGPLAPTAPRGSVSGLSAASSGGGALLPDNSHAQVWKPLESPATSWRDRLASRRMQALAVKHQEEAVKAAEIAANEEAREAYAAAYADVIDVAGPSGTVGTGGDAYKELTEFRVDLDTLETLPENPLQMESSADGGDDDDSWTTVKGKAAEREKARAVTEAVTREETSQQQHQQRGNRRHEHREQGYQRHQRGRGRGFHGRGHGRHTQHHTPGEQPALEVTVEPDVQDQSSMQAPQTETNEVAVSSSEPQPEPDMNVYEESANPSSGAQEKLSWDDLPEVTMTAQDLNYKPTGRGGGRGGRGTRGKGRGRGGYNASYDHSHNPDAVNQGTSSGQVSENQPLPAGQPSRDAPATADAFGAEYESYTHQQPHRSRPDQRGGGYNRRREHNRDYRSHEQHENGHQQQHEQAPNGNVRQGRQEGAYSRPARNARPGNATSAPDVTVTDTQNPSQEQSMPPVSEHKPRQGFSRGQQYHSDQPRRQQPQPSQPRTGDQAPGDFPADSNADSTAARSETQPRPPPRNNPRQSTGDGKPSAAKGGNANGPKAQSYSSHRYSASRQNGEQPESASAGAAHAASHDNGPEPHHGGRGRGRGQYRGRGRGFHGDRNAAQQPAQTPA